MSECWYIDKDKHGCFKPKPTKECSVNQKYCEQDSKQYHKICDRLWDLKESDMEKLSIEELERLEEDADVCIYMRKRSNEMCINPACRNAGHLGAIKKIQNKLRILKHQRYKREIDKLYEKWLENPLDESIYDGVDLKKFEDPKLIFPEIQNISWKKFLGEFVYLNDITFRENYWEKTDPIFPDQWTISVVLPNGEEFISVGKTIEEACQEIMSDLVNVFVTDKKYRKYFWESFKPVGWYDYKTKETVRPQRPLKKRK